MSTTETPAPLLSRPQVYIEDVARNLDAYDGKEVNIKGWLYNKRSSGKLHFLEVRDGTGILQCVMFVKDVSAELFARADHLPQETSLVVSGKVRLDKRSPLGFELGLTGMEVVAEPTKEYPISPKEHGVAFLMDQRHLWLRSRRQHAILRVRAEIVAAVRRYFDSHGFTLVDAPIFTPAACEGTTNLFEVGYFDQKAYLTQSGQLYMEAAAMALGKVYCLGPTFRAEKSKTRRHLTEFWMVEPEVAYLDLTGVMDLAEDFVVSVVEQVLANRRRELEVLERDITKLELVKKPFPRITYEEAIGLLQKAGKETKFGDDFGGDEETVISEHFDRPVMIHHYPAEIKAFYMKRDPQNPKLALGVDLIGPEGYGEIIGGGQREEDLARIEASVEAHGLPREAFEWYLDLRRYGSVPHGGFGLGIERTVSWICGLHHVRETIPFPRMLERLTP
ncbi:MAG: asparagine--tRNA ligase [Deltaproteobacteria bacterium]|nr:asparagine--tRNA ligase [Deltaproteobacteria bacterium]